MAAGMELRTYANKMAIWYTPIIVMADADKILQALGDLQAGQKSLQVTVGQLETRVGYLQTTVEQQGKAIADLQEGQKSLQEGQKTLDLKVEAFYTEQTKANEKIIRLIVDASEANGEAHKALEKRVDRIEKHVGLPPLK